MLYRRERTEQEMVRKDESGVEKRLSGAEDERDDRQ